MQDVHVENAWINALKCSTLLQNTLGLYTCMRRYRRRYSQTCIIGLDLHICSLHDINLIIICMLISCTDIYAWMHVHSLSVIDSIGLHYTNQFIICERSSCMHTTCFLMYSSPICIQRCTNSIHVYICMQMDCMHGNWRTKLFCRV